MCALNGVLNEDVTHTLSVLLEVMFSLRRVCDADAQNQERRLARNVALEVWELRGCKRLLKKGEKSSGALASIGTMFVERRGSSRATITYAPFVTSFNVFPCSAMS